MYDTKYVFSQLTDYLNYDRFRKIVDKYKANSYVKKFTCWNLLMVMLFGQLSKRVSARDLVSAIEAHSRKSQHLGFGEHVSRSNLSKSLDRKDSRVFEDYAKYMIKTARQLREQDIFKLGGNVYAVDSTTIDLCLSVYSWAKFRRAKGGVKAHVEFDLETQVPAFIHITTASVHDVNAMDVIPYEENAFYVFDRGYNDFKRLFHIDEICSKFVVRAKDNLKYEPIRWKRRMPKNIKSDSLIRLTTYNSQKKYPRPLRRIEFHDEELNRDFVFLTNAITLDANTIALLYKNRWQIELFFKWLKQHLNIQRFWGTSLNAVKIQIYSAIIAYCLIAIIHKKLNLKCSIYEMLQVLNMSMTDTSSILDLLKYDNNIDNELDGSSEPTLF